MALVLHILWAVGSLGFATVTAFKPSKTKLLLTYILTAGTIVTGVVLVILAPGSLGSACVSGLLYIGSVAVLVRTARRKLSAAKIS